MRKFIISVLSLLLAVVLCGCGGGGGGGSTTDPVVPSNYRPMGANDQVVYSSSGTLTYTIGSYEPYEVDQTDASASRIVVTQTGTGTAGTRFAVALNLNFISSVYDGSTTIEHTITLLLDQNVNDIYLAGRDSTTLSSPLLYYRAGPISVGSVPTLSMAISTSSTTSTETYGNLVITKSYTNNTRPYPSYMHITGNVTMNVNGTDVVCYPDVYLTLSAIGYNGAFPTPVTP